MPCNVILKEDFKTFIIKKLIKTFEQALSWINKLDFHSINLTKVLFISGASNAMKNLKGTVDLSVIYHLNKNELVMLGDIQFLNYSNILNIS